MADLVTYDTIVNYIDNICIDNDIDKDNIKNVSQFLFILRCVGEVFQRNEHFVTRYPVEYDREKVYAYIPVYIKLCERFGFVPSLYQFSAFSGVSMDALKDWIRDDMRTVGRCKLGEILTIKEASIDEKLANSSQIVGAITLHNDRVLHGLEAVPSAGVVALDSLPTLAGLPVSDDDY